MTDEEQSTLGSLTEGRYEGLATTGRGPQVEVPRAIDRISVVPCPYQGLFAFREEDSPFFFGRSDVTERLVRAVAERPLVAVVGPSGSGKSSLVWAGLVPWLRHDGDVAVAGFRPGERPFHSLAAGFLPLLEPHLTEAERVTEVDGLAQAMRARPGALVEVVRRAREKSGAARLLLVADQFEELYTSGGDQYLFVEQLLAAVDAPRPAAVPGLCVVITLRADFLGHALGHRPFAEALQDADVKLGPMTEEQLRAVVERPAAAQGVAIEDGLTRRLLDAPAGEPDRLPLLEFALTRLWDSQEEGYLTHAAYDRMGGVGQVLAGYADDVYSSLTPTEQQLARRILTRLVLPGKGNEDTGRRASRAEIGEDGWPVVDRLADAGLVITGRDETSGEESVEVVHDALIRRWDRLRGWMSTERAFRSWRERLGPAVHQWEASGRSDGALLRGGPLAEAAEWLGQRSGDVNPAERAFLDASVTATVEANRRRAEAQRQGFEQARALAEERRLRAEEDQLRAEEEQARATVEQARATRLRRAGAVTVAVLVLAAVLVAGSAWSQRNRSARLQLLAVARSLAAESSAESRVHADERAVLMARQAYLLNEENGGELGPQVDRALRDAVTAPFFSRVLAGGRGGVSSVALSPDGRWLVAGGGAALRRWDLRRAGAAPGILEGHREAVPAAAFSPDGRRLATGGSDHTVAVWPGDADASTEPSVVLSGHSGPVRAVSWHPGGGRLASGGADGTVRVWNLDEPSTAAVVLTPGGNRTVAAVAFSPDGGRLAFAGQGGTVQVWPVGDGTPVPPAVLSGAGDRDVVALAWSPDGRLAAAGDTGSVMIFDLNDEGAQAPAVTVAGHKGRVHSLAWSPDGALLASAGQDRTVRLWALTGAGGAERAVLPGHTGAVRAVAFSADGHTLASGSEDGTARLWRLSATPPPVRTADVAAEACRIVGRNFTRSEWRSVAGPGVPYRRTCPDLPGP